MSVLVALANGETYSRDDADGTQVAYQILESGVLAILLKPADEDLAIAREFSPGGYLWVEGKRFLGDAGKLAGADGIVSFD